MWAWALDWAHVMLTAAKIVVLGATPSSYRHPALRRDVLRQIYFASGPLIPWFCVVAALISLVLIRIIVVTAISYGLSQFALGLLVRTLVLEVIPLFAALFVALRYSMPCAQRWRDAVALDEPAGATAKTLDTGSADWLRRHLLPQALGAVFAVMLLAALSGAIALVLTYFSAYGFTLWGLPLYTHAVGQVMSPEASLIFAFKTFFFSLAVAVVPMASAIGPRAPRLVRRNQDILDLARLFSVVLLIEFVSLMGNYA